MEDARIGEVTVIRRSDRALRLNVHLHTLALDGVYVREGEQGQGALRFQALGAPSQAEVAQVAEWTHAALLRVLERHGRSLGGLDAGTDTLSDEQPVLASCYGASAGDVQLLGAAPGQRTAKLVRLVRAVSPSATQADPGRALAEVGGVNVHAEVAFDGRDRRRLERLCRYLARPPLAQERVERQADGRVRYRRATPGPGCCAASSPSRSSPARAARAGCASKRSSPSPPTSPACSAPPPRARRRGSPRPPSSSSTSRWPDRTARAPVRPPSGPAAFRGLPRRVPCRFAVSSQPQGRVPRVHARRALPPRDHQRRRG